ncbi:MAG: hypothetical protein H6918_11180 [Sphingomonadaceae bacterium]|nr:hypothetical protein [Sphingomonadaceae bacterium]
MSDGSKDEGRSALKTLGIGGAVVVGFAAIASLLGSPAGTPEEKAARQADVVKAEQKAEEDKEASLAQAKEREAEVALVWYNRIISISEACDSSTSELQTQFEDIGNGSNVYTIYETARTTRDKCGEAWKAYESLEAPSEFSGELRDKATETSEACASAFFAKRQFADIAMEIADGDQRPSKVAEGVDYAKAGGAGVMLCVASAMETATLAGADLSDISPKTD